MNNQKLFFRGLIHSLGVLVYVAFVVLIMQNGDRIFGPAGYFGGVAILMLFVVSAAITGLLVLSKPVLLYLNGAKKESVHMLFYTVAWLAIITIIILAILATLK